MEEYIRSSRPVQQSPAQKQLKSICFDVVEFYPSITEELLHQALNFAKQHYITSNEHQIMVHARQPLLYYKQTPWCKKRHDNFFDVTTGSYDGAEVCELLVGSYLLHKLTIKFGNNVGLYRDDGLAEFKGIGKGKGKSTANRTHKKQICEIFTKNNHLKIMAAANSKIVDFLDVTLNLNTGLHMQNLTASQYITSTVNRIIQRT